MFINVSKWLQLTGFLRRKVDLEEQNNNKVTEQGSFSDYAQDKHGLDNVGINIDYIIEYNDNYIN